METKKLNTALVEHKKWLESKGGERADLSEANLSGANLRWADLSEADLSEADLSGANLSGANLRRANLRGANLRGANLSGADLSEANLRRANLRGANLSGAKLPSPTMFLLCNWGKVSDKLTLDLMRYDASNHPVPSKFDDWSRGNGCPFMDCQFERSANFTQKAELWKAGKAKSALKLVLLLFKEKEIKL